MDNLLPIKWCNQFKCGFKKLKTSVLFWGILSGLFSQLGYANNSIDLLTLNKTKQGKTNTWQHKTGNQKIDSLIVYQTHLANKLAHKLAYKVPQVSLIKKYHDWQQQHVSGVEFILDESPQFSNVKKLTLSFKLNAELSQSLSRSQLSTFYPKITSDNIAKWDNQDFILSVKLLSAEYKNQATEKYLMAELDIVIPHQANHESVFSFNITPQDLTYYWVENWQRTPIQSLSQPSKLTSQLTSQPIPQPTSRLWAVQLTAETKNHKVARHYIEAYKQVENYKVIDLSLMKFRLETH